MCLQKLQGMQNGDSCFYHDFVFYFYFIRLYFICLKKRFYFEKTSPERFFFFA